jgi:hypothetical protein
MRHAVAGWQMYCAVWNAAGGIGWPAANTTNAGYCVGILRAPFLKCLLRCLGCGSIICIACVMLLHIQAV